MDVNMLKHATRLKFVVGRVVRLGAVAQQAVVLFLSVVAFVPWFG